MNKAIILSNGIFTCHHGTYCLSIEYPHSKVVGYNTQGRNITVIEWKKQVFYGIFKQDCKNQAMKFLANEKWESQRMVHSGYGIQFTHSLVDRSKHTRGV